jgi:hypothetical protein
LTELERQQKLLPKLLQKDPKMATKKPAAKSTSTAVVKWDEELARQAQVAAAVEESTATGQFFSLKSGVLSFNGNQVPGNEMAVVILDSILETIYYEGEYDTENPSGPTAFAFGREEKSLTWHENSAPDFAGKLCSESEVCEWGSAEKGRGKAARETRRLAMIPAGMIENGKFKPFEDEDDFANSAIGYMKLPVTSVKGYAGFVKQIAGALKRPPHGIFAKVKVVPDSATQFKVVFEALSSVPDDLMGTIMQRHEEAVASIEFPYPAHEEQEAKPARGRKATPPARDKAAAKPAAKTAARAKRY